MLLSRRGYTLVPSVQRSFGELTPAAIGRYYRQVLAQSRKGDRSQTVDVLVFSRDRAMQLHAFLRSFYRHVHDAGQIRVLYKASSPAHRQAYETLGRLFPEVDLIEERDFRLQLLDMCAQSQAKTLLLCVDDMLFLRDVDCRQLLEWDLLEHVVCLTRNPRLTYSIVLQKPLLLPSFQRQGTWMRFRWDEVSEYGDWTYPLGVGGYCFDRDELLAMWSLLDFRAPNSLESSMQNFLPLFKERWGVCPAEAASVCVHANLVQEECDSPVIGSRTVDELLSLWEQGLCIDLDAYYGLEAEVAEQTDYTFVSRENMSGS